jgi:hypothetical protein
MNAMGVSTGAAFGSRRPFPNGRILRARSGVVSRDATPAKRRGCASKDCPGNAGGSGFLGRFARIGLETNNAAADYIAVYNGDKKTLMESLAVVQTTAARILDDLLPFELIRQEHADGKNEEWSCQKPSESTSLPKQNPADAQSSENTRTARPCRYGPLNSFRRLGWGAS